MTTNARTAFPAPATGTPPRSCGRIFTCGEAQIATSPFIYRGVGIFMPEKVGNLQLVIHAVVLEELDCLVSLEKLEILKVLEEY